MTVRPRLISLLLSLALVLTMATFAGSADYTITADDVRKEPISKVSAKNREIFYHKAPTRYLPAPPKNLELCGEPVPMQLAFVAEQMDREFNIAVHDQAQVVMWMKRQARYFPYISGKLKEAGLPDDLKYLAVAESALIKRARSIAGAVGLWQFIAGTGSRYGLRRDRWFDDRLNLEKSTEAAMAYLKDLYDEFGTWSLAMAAYNCGESRVRKEIAEQGVKDYYHLYLPQETMRYVYRILSAKIILGSPERYGYKIGSDRLYEPIAADVVTISSRRPVHLRNLALAASTTVRNLKDLNPEIRGYYLAPGKQVIKIPQGSSKGFQGRLARLGPGRPPTSPGRVWVVKSGDTLSRIASENGVKIKDLQRANGIDGSKLYPGQRIKIP